MSVGFGAGFEGIVRPFAQRQASGDWNKQIWVAAVRYQRPGPIGLRVDAGLIPSPVGLANLMLRPQLNPTVSLPASLFTALPPVEPGAPRTTLLGAVYPYGASATVSGARWDARAAVIDTSPLRTRRVFAEHQPAALRQRGRRRRRHAVCRPARRRVGHARRLAERPARARRSPRTATPRSSRSNPSSRTATRSCLESGSATRSRPRAASESPRAGSSRDSRR